VELNRYRPIVIETLEQRHLLSTGTLRIAAMQNIASESGSPVGQFLISRTGELASELIVPLSTSGTATNAVDYLAIGSFVRFKKNVNQIRLNIAAKPDSLVEGDESVVITLGRVTDYAFTKRSASLNVHDTTVLVGFFMSSVDMWIRPSSPPGL
jgi:hypothetical protein